MSVKCLKLSRATQTIDSVDTFEGKTLEVGKITIKADAAHVTWIPECARLYNVRCPGVPRRL